MKGFISLISILIISAVLLTISIGLSARSVGESNMSISQEKAQLALQLANLCAEQALMKLESVLNYSGNETIIIEGESCDILFVEGTGNLNRVVKARSSVSGYTKKVRIDISQISPLMQINKWEEVSDF